MKYTIKRINKTSLCVRLKRRKTSGLPACRVNFGWQEGEGRLVVTSASICLKTLALTSRDPNGPVRKDLFPAIWQFTQIICSYLGQSRLCLSLSLSFFLSLFFLMTLLWCAYVCAPLHVHRRVHELEKGEDRIQTCLKLHVYVEGKG